MRRALEAGFRIVSVVAGLYLLGQSYYYQGVYIGYNVAAVQFAGICYPSYSGLCIYEGDPYISLANVHVYLNWAVSLLLLCLFISKETLARICSVLLSILILSLFTYVYLFKAQYVSVDSEYLNPIRETEFAS